jgi:hypothetical protein
MKAGPDINDTLRSEGSDAARDRSDRAQIFNGIDQDADGSLRENAVPEEEEFLPESTCYGDAPIKAPPALIKDVLPQEGVATLGGQSGSGKTFHAIHMGVCFIPEMEQKFYIDRYPIKRKGGVLYLLLEGRASFPVRLDVAVSQLRPRPVDMLTAKRIPFLWNSYKPFLFDKGPDGLIKRFVSRICGRVLAPVGCRGRGRGRSRRYGKYGNHRLFAW